MATPKVFTKQVINTTSDQDALQIKDVKGDVLGWIDSTGTGQGNLAGLGGGVSSFNNLSGAVTLAAGNNVTLTPAGNTITIASTGGGTPASPTTSIQFNNSGAFGGSANLIWNNSSSFNALELPNATTTGISIGQTMPNSIFGAFPEAYLSIHFDDATAAQDAIIVHCGDLVQGMTLYAHGNDGFIGPAVSYYRSKGTQASPTPVTSGGNLGYINFGGYNGDLTQTVPGYIQTGNFGFHAGENFDATHGGTNFSLQLAPIGSTAQQPVLTLSTSILGLKLPLIQLGPSGGTADVGISRISAGTVTIGNATQGDFSGSLKLGNETLTSAAPTVAAAQVGLGSTTAATATAGGGQAVPATVLGYLVANVAGTTVKIPYFSN